MPARIEKLSRALMRRSMRLLDMEYKPSEIADELAATKEQITRMLTAGAPARKDARGHYWVNGLTFVKWLNDVAPKKTGDKRVFEDNEAYCFTCRQTVKFTAHRRAKNVIYGTCPEGHKTARIVSTKSAKAQKASETE